MLTLINIRAVSGKQKGAGLPRPQAFDGIFRRRPDRPECNRGNDKQRTMEAAIT